MRASSFIENFPQISAKTIAFQQNLLGKLPIVFWETGLENPREIGFFSREFAPENLAKFDFFSRNLPEALILAKKFLLGEIRVVPC